MAVLWLLARRQLVSHGTRAALTAAGVACGVALVVAIRIINASTLAAFTEAIEDLAGTAALQVRGSGPFSEAVADRIRDVPGVQHAVPILTATFFAVDPPVAGEALSVFAADVTDGHAIETLHLVESGDHVVDDPLSFLADPYSVVLTDRFAARLGLGVGSTLRLRIPTGITTFTVRGVLPPGGVGRAFGGNLLLMDVVGAQVVLGRDGLVDQVDVTLAPGTRVEDVTARVSAVLDAGLEAIPPARHGEQIERYLRSYQTLLAGVSGLALLAAVFVVGSAVATSVAARRREIGLLRCAGAVRAQVRRLFLTEAIGTAVVGIALGLPLGVALARLLVGTMRESAELLFSMRFFATGLEIAPDTLALGAIAGLGAALGAGWIPAREAAGLSPLTAVRSVPAGSPAGRWPPAAAIAAAAALTALGIWGEVHFDSAWSGNLAAIAVDVALVALFMRVAGPAAALALRPLEGRGGLAAGRLRQLPVSLALAGGVLALGLGLMIMAGTLARSFEGSMLDFIRHQVRADLVVASAATTGWIESPLHERLAERLLAVPGVARVERVRLAEQTYAGIRISVDSLDESAFAATRVDDFRFAAGDPSTALAAVRAGRGVLVSKNFARQFRVGLGDTVRLDTPGGTYMAPVAGVVVDYVSPRGSVVVARPTYQRWWHDRSANRFHVFLDAGARVDAVRQAIAAGLGAEEGLTVRTERELWAYHQDAVRRAFRFTRALEVLPLLVAGLGLAEALLAVSIDRRREFALLRAAGATRGQLVRSVVTESAGVGLLGLGGGIGMGLVLALLWVRVNFAYQIGWDLDLHFAPGTLLVAALAALVVSVPAGMLPARRVARLQVMAALREE